MSTKLKLALAETKSKLLDAIKGSGEEKLHISELKALRQIVNVGPEGNCDGQWVQLAGLWLKICLSRKYPWSARWEHLEEHLCTVRESELLVLWGVLRGCGRSQFEQYAQQWWGGWDYYVKAVSVWFLGRYDLPNARMTLLPPPYPKSWFSFSNLFDFVLLAAALPAWFLSLESPTEVWPVFGFLGMLLLLCWGIFWWWGRSLFFLQTLVPRLFFTIVIGYLFILSGGSEAIKQIVATYGTVGTAAGSLIILAFVGGYLLVEMAQRTDPLPRVRKRVFRALRIVGLGLAYSMTIGSLLGIAVWNRTSDLDWQFRVFSMFVAFGVGLSLQIAWEEKALTEPL